MRSKKRFTSRARCGEHLRWLWVRFGCNTFAASDAQCFGLESVTLVEVSPEKAGVGGSTPSLATTFQ